MGELAVQKAIDASRDLVLRCPDNPLYYKRLAELYADAGDRRQARLTMAEALACDPDSAFLVFAMGQLLVRIGAEEQAEAQILHAAELDDITAAIQGAAGQICLKRGEKQRAQVFLQRAKALCPTYKRFSNQLKRAEG